MKKFLLLMLAAAFCLISCFNAFAFKNETIYGVKATSIKSPSEGTCYMFSQAGTEGELRGDWSFKTLRVYLENRSNEKATIEIWQTKKGKKTRLASIPLRKGQYKYHDVSGKFNTEYSIKLSKGSEVIVAAAQFLNSMPDDKALKRKYK